ncbi:MAG: aldehyde ferredoxin oxidoreductase C-terminal domain-containing protein [Desulfobaccales bacterium]|jgi:aldehyde:ferredoxin oxidoreductase
MKDEYYDQRDWDKAAGIPTREKLTELGLEEVADEVLGRKD